MIKTKEKGWGAFCDLFGATSRNRVLEIFLEGREIDNSLGNIAEEGNINRATVYNAVRELLGQEVIVPTRKVGKTQLYKLNLNNSNVKAIAKVFDLTLKLAAKEVKTENEKAVAR